MQMCDNMRDRAGTYNGYVSMYEIVRCHTIISNIVREYVRTCEVTRGCARMCGSVWKLGDVWDHVNI